MATHITFNQLHQEVCRVANVLRAWGVKRGDTVALYMPMIPELGASGCGCLFKKFDASLQLTAWALPLQRSACSSYVLLQCTNKRRLTICVLPAPVVWPLISTPAYTMLACARVGAVHSVVFAGLSAESLRDRINDASSKWVVTAEQGRRGGKALALKDTVGPYQAVALHGRAHACIGL